MNYSTFDQTYCSSNKHVRSNDNINKSYKDRTKKFYDPLEVSMHQDKYTPKNFNSNYDKAVMMTKGIICEDELDPVTIMFFSDDNINRIQKMIKREIMTRGYKLVVDQDESDLLIAMRAVYFDANNGARFLPFKIKRQVKNLNNHVVQYVIPDMIETIKEDDKYSKEINQPLQPMLRPMNVNAAGRKTLPSLYTFYNS